MSAVHRTRDREKTRRKIVAAARAEFAAKGYAGARMEQIAARAGVNKELIYHYFHGKEALFKEARSEQLADAEASHAVPQAPLGDHAPQRPAELFAWRFQKMLADLEWIKFLTWEAAQGDVIPNADARRATIREAITALEKAQKKSAVPAGLDPRMLQLAVFALATYPLAFSQITTMTTGMSASDKRFQAAWIGFLRKLGVRLLSPRGALAAPTRAAARRTDKRKPRQTKPARARRVSSGETK
jgi:AcrR family transcriptional regulator